MSNLVDVSNMSKEELEALVNKAMSPNVTQDVIQPIVKVEETIEEVPLKVTTMEDLALYAKGTLVRFPDFAEGQPFVARVRRPSMLALAKSGELPNALLSTANELFANGNKGLDTDDENMLKDMYKVMETMCKSALIEPTLEDINNIGMTLSDDQLMAVFNYTQVGVAALKSFR